MAKRSLAVRRSRLLTSIFSLLPFIYYVFAVVAVVLVGRQIWTIHVGNRVTEEIVLGLLSGVVIYGVSRGRKLRVGDDRAVLDEELPRGFSEPAAEEGQLRYELLSQHSREIVLFIGGGADGKLTVADANAAAATAYGFDREEMRDLPIESIFDRNSVAACRWAAGTDRLAPVTFEADHRRRDGAVFSVEISTFSSVISGNQLIVVLGRDITARKRRIASEQLLHEIDRRILHDESLDEVLAFTSEELARLYDFPLVQLSIKGEDGHVDIRKWAGQAPEFLEQIEVRYDDTAEGAGPTGTAIRTGELQIRDLASDPGFKAWRDRAQAFGFRQAVAFPLIASERTLGALTLFRKSDDSLDVETMNVLATFADQIAMSLVAARGRELLNLQRVALDSAANAVLVTDGEGKIQWVNRAFSRLTGYRREEAVGRKPSMFKSGNHSEAFYRQMWETLRDGRVWSGEIYNRRKDGSIYLEEQTITPVSADDGRATHYVAIKQDITARKRHEEEIRHLAMHDSLTNLPNRRSLEAAMVRMCRQAEEGLHSALLILDVDNFKSVNDSVGHAAGDQLLAEAATILRDSLRPTDFLARLGGDEFAVLLADGERPLEVAERLRAAFDRYQFHYDGVPFDLTVSIGLAPMDGSAEGSIVMVRADSALYAAKARGKNRAVAWPFGEEEGLQLAAASRWASRIKSALRENKLVLHYQPIVHIGSGEAAHFEALLRMIGDDGTPIPAHEFISAAERFGLMPQIDRWVVERVIEVLASRDDARIFVNLSGASLCDESLLAFIVEKATNAALRPGRLAFEITESAAVSDLRRAQSWIARLKELGCLFALDDFGIGFSSFSYLRILPADYVKIDRSFVHDVDTNATNRALVQAVRTVANTLGKEVIAEGVETEQLAKVLGSLGVELGQGFHWGMPACDCDIPRLG